jgi:hypothetical protein
LALAVSLGVGAGCGSAVGAAPDAGGFIVDAAVGGPDTGWWPDAAAPDAAWPDGGTIDPTGSHTQYVADSIDVPTTASEATALGLDLDGDPMLRPDNALGQILAVLVTEGGGDPQGAVDNFVAQGTLIHIMDLQATSLVDATGVGFGLFVGQDSDVPAFPADNFSGAEMFLIAPETPTDGFLEGAITGGHLGAGPGTVPLMVAVDPDLDPILLHLVGAKVVADVGPTNVVNGRLGGALTGAEVDNVLLPALHDIYALIVAEDCPGGVCTAGSAGETLLDLFDENKDGMITLAELQESALIQSLFAPDVDLFDATGAYNPRVDGLKDSLSFGVGFTAVGAVFALP